MRTSCKTTWTLDPRAGDAAVSRRGEIHLGCGRGEGKASEVNKDGRLLSVSSTRPGGEPLHQYGDPPDRRGRSSSAASGQAYLPPTAPRSTTTSTGGTRPWSPAARGPLERQRPTAAGCPTARAGAADGPGGARLSLGQPADHEVNDAPAAHRVGLRARRKALPRAAHSSTFPTQPIARRQGLPRDSQPAYADSRAAKLLQRVPHPGGRPDPHLHRRCIDDYTDASDDGARPAGPRLPQPRPPRKPQRDRGAAPHALLAKCASGARYFLEYFGVHKVMTGCGMLEAVTIQSTDYGSPHWFRPMARTTARPRWRMGAESHVHWVPKYMSIATATMGPSTATTRSSAAALSTRARCRCHSWKISFCCAADLRDDQALRAARAALGPGRERHAHARVCAPRPDDDAPGGVNDDGTKQAVHDVVSILHHRLHTKPQRGSPFKVELTAPPPGPRRNRRVEAVHSQAHALVLDSWCVIRKWLRGA